LLGKVRAGDGKEVSRDDTDIVSALRAALTERVGPQRYELWFGAGTRLHLADGTLTLTFPSLFFQDWVRGNFRGQIEDACRQALGTCPALDFRVDPFLAEVPGEPPAHNGVKAAAPGAVPRAAQPSPRAASLVHQEDGERTPAQQRRSGGPSHRRFANLESFVAGQSNRLARTSAEMAACRPGELSPLLIHGPTGVGKTHLLEGIWTAVRKSGGRTTVVYLAAEQFTTFFLDALRGSGLPSFRRKYRGVDVLIIDDLQFFCGKRATQVELLYTIDTLMREGRQLAFAADRPPAELSELGPELVTRLESGLVCRIDPPEHATRLGIVAHLARRLGVEVPEGVRQFVAAHFSSHARELSGALCRLRATSQALGRAIDLPMAQEALGEMIRARHHVVRLPDIQRAVCDVFQLDPDSLLSDGKARSVSYPRMLAMWLARKHTRAALSEIGQFFGRRSHSTVISAQKRVERWLADGRPVELADRPWDVDEAIRRVEHCLRAG
jgi:chromosomal replication initiator protein